MTFAPPVVIAIAYPDGFVAALGFAAIPLSILAIILPAAIVLTLRKKQWNQKNYRTTGGNKLILLAIIFGIIVIASPLYSAI